MGKSKKKQAKGEASPTAAAQAPSVVPEPLDQPTLPASGPEHPEGQTPPSEGLTCADAAAAPAPAQPAAVPAPPSRFRRWLPDLIKAGAALAVIGIAATIWYKPPLTLASFPYVSYRYQGKTLADAQLFRPLAMPTRYYIRLPQKLEGHYEWFAVDRRREVAALTEAPSHRLLGRDAIKRSDALGLDLEFRKLDHSEWQVHFLSDAIIFSNAVLSVRMDAKAPSGDAH